MRLPVIAVPSLLYSVQPCYTSECSIRAVRYCADLRRHSTLPQPVECTQKRKVSLSAPCSVPPLGLEPRTCGLKVRSSTN